MRRADRANATGIRLSKDPSALSRPVSRDMTLGQRLSTVAWMSGAQRDCARCTSLICYTGVSIAGQPSQDPVDKRLPDGCKVAKRRFSPHVMSLGGSRLARGVPYRSLRASSGSWRVGQNAATRTLPNLGGVVAARKSQLLSPQAFGARERRTSAWPARQPSRRCEACRAGGARHAPRLHPESPHTAAHALFATVKEPRFSPGWQNPHRRHADMGVIPTSAPLLVSLPDRLCSEASV